MDSQKDKIKGMNSKMAKTKEALEKLGAGKSLRDLIRADLGREGPGNLTQNFRFKED